MIRFERVPKPATFAADAEIPGNGWLAENPTGRPPDYWKDFKAQLATGFRDLCAYCAMFEPVGTVDHFVSVHEDRSRAYEWDNYRYTAAWINSSKNNLTSTQMLDPFEIEDDWFEILLPSLQLVVSATIPETHRELAEFVLRRLHLRDDERVLRQRRAWYELYQEGRLNLDGLRRLAPLIAQAVEKTD